jgi:hypothetical protein
MRPREPAAPFTFAGAAEAPATRTAILLVGLGIAAACSAPGPPAGAGASPSGAATTSSGTGGAGGSTGSGWYADGGLDATALPVIPGDCVAVADAGLPEGLAQYVCPPDAGDAGQVQNCGGPSSTDPGQYVCPANFCTPGCADLPCPSVPCPATTTSLWTCGPGKPDLEPGCVIVATRPAPDSGVGQRFSACCP